MRLINGDRLLMKLKQHRLLFFKAYGDFSCFSEKDKARVDEIDNCIAEVINAPTIDSEELRPKGQWILRDDKGNGVCNQCNRQDKIDPMATHCRYCGAKMEVDK